MLLFTSVVAAYIGGCATDVALPEPDRRTPPAYRNADAGATLPRPSTQWWREFGSAELDRLQDSALENNRELAVAIARVAQAHAQSRIAEAAQSPTLDVFAKRDVQAPEDGPASGVSRQDWRAVNRYQIGLRANYEVDLWGRQGYAAESALALAAASVHQREAVALTLTADVAGAYLEYLSINERIEIAERTIESRRHALAAIEGRVRGGEATAVEAAQFRVALSTSESALAALLQRRERAHNRLAVLAGIAPADLKLDARRLDAVRIPAINPGLPSELLCRRPDVRRAEALLAASDFDVRAVRANMLPSFSLLGEVGFGARNLAALSGPASLFLLAAANAAHSILDGGRKEAQLDLSQARRLEALAQYSGTLLTALGEVEDALSGTRVTANQHRVLSDAFEAARLSHALNRRALDVGAIDRIGLLDLEQKMYVSADSAASMLHDRMRAAIDLFKSLGGGTRRDGEDPCAK